MAPEAGPEPFRFRRTVVLLDDGELAAGLGDFSLGDGIDIERVATENELLHRVGDPQTGCLLVPSESVEEESINLVHQVIDRDTTVPVLVYGATAEKAPRAIDSGAIDVIRADDDPAVIRRRLGNIIGTPASTENWQSHQYQRVLSEIGQQALEGDDLDRLLADSATRTSDALGNARCFFLESDPESEAFRSHGDVYEATALAEFEDQAVTALEQRVILASTESLEEAAPFENLPIGRDETFTGVMVPITQTMPNWGVFCALAPADDRFSPTDLDFVQSVANLVGASIDSAAYEQTLAALHEATRELMHVESEHEVSQVIVDVATEVLDLPRVTFYLFDTDENVLRPDAYSQHSDDEGPPPAFTVEEQSITWKVFVDGTTTIYDDVRESAQVYNLETRIRSGMFVPVGEYGMFTATSTESGAFDGNTQELVELLAATAEAALVRIRREQSIRNRDWELQQQNNQLRRLDQINQILREIDRAIVRAGSREEIEHAVCQRLVDTDWISFSWIGESEPIDGTVTPRVWAGEDRGYLDSQPFSIDDSIESEPAGKTAATGEVTVVPNVAAELQTEPWRRSVLSAGYQSMVSVPLAYEDFLYGVLTVYSTHPMAFDVLEQTVLAELGETIAYAFTAIERKEALLTDTVNRLTFTVSDSSAILLRIARKLCRTISVQGIVPRSEEASLVFLHVQAASPEQITAELEGFTAVNSPRVINQAEDGTLVQCQITQPFIATVLADQGAVVQELTADEQVMRVIVEVPTTLEVQSIAEFISSRFPGAELAAKHELARPAVQTEASQRPILDRLTDRQREVVQAAYLSGYFDWPRESTGEEVATALGISNPAFQRHIRRVQDTVFSALLEPKLSEGSGDVN